MSVQSKLIEIAVDPDRRKKAGYAAAASVAAILAGTFLLGRASARGSRAVKKSSSTSVSSEDEATARTSRRAFNPEFMRQLRGLLKIMVPGLFSRESGIIFCHSLILISRTFLTIFVAALEGRIVKAIVQKDIRKFFWQISKWLLVAVPATFVNSMIRFCESHLGLAFRTRLTEHAYKEYFAVWNYFL